MALMADSKADLTDLAAAKTARQREAEAIIDMEANRVGELAEVEALRRRVAELEAQFQEHTKAVGGFLSEMYATMIDPLADGQMKVTETCRALLEAARQNRDLEHEQAQQIAGMREALSTIKGYFADMENGLPNDDPLKRLRIMAYAKFYRAIDRGLALASVSSEAAKECAAIAVLATIEAPEENPYFVEVDSNGCDKCGKGRTYHVIQLSDGIAGSVSHDEDEDASAEASNLSEAYTRGFYAALAAAKEALSR